MKVEKSGSAPINSKPAVFMVATALLCNSPLLRAAAQPESVLMQELRKRDAIITDLERRVMELELKVNSAQSVTSKGGRSPEAVARPKTHEPPSASPQKTAATPAPKSGTDTQAPGSVVVDERAADRALERTLTTQGALLLPQGAFEITPYFSYARRESDFPGLVPVTGGVAVGTQRTERNEFNLGVRGALGLPYDSQIEIDIPYRIVDQSLITSVGAAPSAETNDTGSSIGDLRIGIAKTLTREQDWRPDLVGRLTWDTDTGDQADNGVSLGIGYNEFQASLTALKRQDPLAFTATIAYTTSLEKDNVQPGDKIGLTFGASLASSPSTSLSAALAQTFEKDTKVYGEALEGSGRNASSLLIGTSSVLGRQTLLSVTAGVGLTDAAPDYSLDLALPVRFW